MTQKAATAAPKATGPKATAPSAAVSKPAGSKVAASKTAAPKPAASKHRDSDPMAWLTADDTAFAEHARWLASAKGRATRDRLLRNGLAGQFAAGLLSAASGEMARQVESWKLVGSLFAQEPWQGPLRAAGIESAPPSPRSFAGVPLTPIVHALLGLYGKDALAWCIYAYLTRTGSAATEIGDAIVAHALAFDAILEAIEAALTELEAEPETQPSGIPTKIAKLLAQRLATTAAPHADNSAVARISSLIFNREQTAALIAAMLAAQLPADVSLGDNLHDALAESAWIEADDALARALQQTPALREAIREPTALSPELRNQIGAIIQAVRTSAAKRELEIEGSPGSETTFDPVKHAQDDPRITPTSRVRLLTPTVFQGRGANRRVLRTADVEPA
jgi:hypothetical protein